MMLRDACLGDKELYYHWANSPLVRKQSFSRGLIGEEEHRIWFRRHLMSDTSFLYVLINGEHDPLGQIRFEKSRSDASTCYVSYSLDEIARGQGLAKELIRMGLLRLQEQWNECTKVYAEVRATNQASAKALLSADFTEDRATKDGIRCFSKTIH